MTPMNEPCCTLPPVEGRDYQPHGKFVPHPNVGQSYVTGSEGTGKVIIIAYDIFGFMPQTIQGADILATQVDAKVIVPDFFRGKVMDRTLYRGPSTAQKEEGKRQFFATTGNFGERLRDAVTIAEEVRQDSSIKKVGFLGFCWGGKVALMAGGSEAFDAVASVHPSWVDAKEADNVRVPIALFPTDDGEQHKRECEAFVATLKDRGQPFTYHWYEEYLHGFATSRAQLDDPGDRQGYAEIYSKLAAFFKTHLN